jgi:hypothetical protein
VRDAAGDRRGSDWALGHFITQVTRKSIRSLLPLWLPTSNDAPVTKGGCDLDIGKLCLAQHRGELLAGMLLPLDPEEHIDALSRRRETDQFCRRYRACRG